MEPITYVLIAAALAWIVYRQFVGRYASPNRMLLPLVLIVLGLSQASGAHIGWSAGVIGVVALDLLVTVVLGAIRGQAIAFSTKDGYLYQRGGVLSLLLWLVSIGARVLFEVFTHGTAAAPATAATLTLSFGASIAAQYAVLYFRIKNDGRPIRPSGDRRSAPSRSTLGR